ncbi:ParB N-terminal domain-containing protein [Vibrio fortis]|uniref:ParB N-terminal domain-containing protein n=1 Tax=Vibrio fortis TaxID=212667 RepID=UPI00406888C9
MTNKRRKNTANKNNNIHKKVALFNESIKVLTELIPSLPPACQVNLIAIADIEANQYNPNKMAPPESKLLVQSIVQDGLTMPVLVNRLSRHTEQYVLIDGFHRYQLVSRHPQLQPLPGYIPAVVLELTEERCMPTSVRHNLARGCHQVELTAELTIQLKEMGWSNQKICQELGMDKDEVLRMQQVTGLAAAFKNQDFSQAWK